MGRDMREPEQLDLLDWLAMQPPCPTPPTADLPPVAPAVPDLSPVHLTRVDPACNMRRFYSLALASSLFGDCGVVRRWGRIGTAGQSQTDWYREPCKAGEAFRSLLRAKRRRGYGL